MAFKSADKENSDRSVFVISFGLRVFIPPLEE